MPTDWENASIQKVLIGDNEISITYEKSDKQLSIEVTQTEKKWGISIEIPEAYTKVKVLGKEVSSDTKGWFSESLDDWGKNEGGGF
jgi:hypothetical protein